MSFKVVSLGFLVASVSFGAAMGSPLSKEELDAAIKSVADIEEPGVGECVRKSGTTVAYETNELDLNGDGRNEVIVHSFPKELGSGVTSCYGMIGQNIFVATSDANGVWTANLGYDTQKLEFHDIGQGKYQDIELIGRGFCFPIWRFHEGSYGIWKTCDQNNNLIYADSAEWVNGGIPRDADGSVAKPGNIELAAYSPETDLDGPEFWHNDSLMVAQPSKGLIIYKKPKKSLSGSVKPGDVLFRGKPWDLYEQLPGLQGTAYIFRKGCAPEPYAVYGGQRQSWHTIVLRGEAPVRAKKGCEIVSKTFQGGNAELIFESAID